MVCVADICVVSSKLDFNGKKVAVASIGPDINSGLSPLASNAQYFLIFDTNKSFESVSNPFRNIANVDENLAAFLVQKEAGTVVIANSSYAFGLALQKAGLECLQMKGRVSDIVGINSFSGNNSDLVSIYCKKTNTVDLKGSKLAILSPDRNSSGVVAVAEHFSKFFLIFENGVFENLLKNDFNRADQNFYLNMASLLKENDVNRLVVGYRNVSFSQALIKNNIQCIYYDGNVPAILNSQ